MATWNGEPSQGTGGDSCNPPPPSGPAPDQAASRAGNKVFKSGPLFISSKGIGWTSWKKRWFILTRTSLVFFRSDPNAVPQRGSDNLTLGGIDLNNSGSVVVKADKKLLTVLFPDGRDGRTFTLKAETLEDLYEWKTALETALTQAPSATLVTGQNGMLSNDQAGATDGSAEQLKDKRNMKSMVIGRPILLALEDVDGTPSFLEKALRFIEQHGVKVEGILRQAADVDHVEHRIREYEQGKVDFSPDEDAHVIADCIKYVIRELPSYPVPASCCKALLDVCRIDRERRVNAMRVAICETFPEPNRRLLQRILVMMQRVAAHKAVNRMNPAAVAACMAPLLLRPLLSGDCDIEHDFDVGGDGSAQLLQAAAAANHAQGIVMTLLEEYDSIFGEGSLSPDLYAETDESGSEGEEGSDDEYYEDDEDEEDEEYDEEDEEFDDEEDEDEEADDEEDEESGGETDEDSGSLSSPSRNVDDGDSVHKNVVSGSTSGSQSPAAVHDLKDDHMPQSEKEKPQKIENIVSNRRSTDPLERHSKSAEALEITPREERSVLPTSSHTIQKSTSIAARRPAMLGRTPAKKRSESVGSIDIDMEKSAIQKLEADKADLEAKIAEEAKETKVLLANLESRKRAFFERRQALQNDVARLQEQLQKERDLRRTMEAGNQDPRKSGPCAATIGEKLKAYLDQLAAAEADMNSLRLKVDQIGKQLIKRGGSRESNDLPRPSKNDQGKVTGKQNETENTRTSQPDEKMTHSKGGATADKSSSSKDQQLQAQTPQQHEGSNKTQPPLRQLVPVDSKKHRKFQLESVGSRKSRTSEELVNFEAAKRSTGGQGERDRDSSQHPSSTGSR